MTVQDNPYAPPRCESVEGAGPHIDYKPLGWKTTGAAVGMIVMVVDGLLLGVLPMMVEGSLAQNIRLAIAILLASVVMLGATLWTAVVYLLWTYHAGKNVRALGREGIEYSPGWAVGSWFVPFANLVIPYEALKEIWRASRPTSAQGDLGWKDDAVPTLFPLWWATYLIHGGISWFGVVFRGLSTAHKDPADIGGGVWGIFAHFFLAMAAVAVISIMKQVAHRQEVSAAQMRAST